MLTGILFIPSRAFTLLTNVWLIVSLNGALKLEYKILSFTLFLGHDYCNVLAMYIIIVIEQDFIASAWVDILGFMYPLSHI
jgi:hypothetical protein